MLIESTLQSAVSAIRDPEIGRSLGDLKMVRSVAVSGTTASVGIDSLIAMGQIIAGRLSATTTYVVSTDGGDTWAEIAGPVGIDPSTLSALAIVNSEVTP